MENRTKKQCYECQKYLPFDHFHRDKARPDGYKLRCKICRNRKNRAYYKANAEHFREYKREYRLRPGNKEKQVAWVRKHTQKFADKYKEYRKQYYEDNREHYKEWFKAYHEKHKEEIRAKARAYYHEHKERIKARRKELKEKRLAEAQENERLVMNSNGKANKGLQNKRRTKGVQQTKTSKVLPEKQTKTNNKKQTGSSN